MAGSMRVWLVSALFLLLSQGVRATSVSDPLRESRSRLLIVSEALALYEADTGRLPALRSMEDLRGIGRGLEDASWLSGYELNRNLRGVTSRWDHADSGGGGGERVPLLWETVTRIPARKISFWRTEYPFLIGLVVAVAIPIACRRRVSGLSCAILCAGGLGFSMMLFPTMPRTGTYVFSPPPAVRHVLFLDGHVEAMEEERFQMMVSGQAAERSAR